MLPFSQFNGYWKALVNLPARERYTKEDLLCDRFQLFSESGVDAYYIPFHHLNGGARVVVVGVTPCWAQLERAFSVAKQGLANGLSKHALFTHIDRTCRFDGPMRWNFVEMLDGIGLQHRLEIDSCAALFRDTAHLAHFTSTVSAPLFRGGQDYTGAAPKLLNVPRLRELVVNHLGEELRALPDAVIIPLGDVPGEALRFLHERKSIGLERCLSGFPHPSAANLLRRTKYEQGRRYWADQITSVIQSRRAATRVHGEAVAGRGVHS